MSLNYVPVKLWTEPLSKMSNHTAWVMLGLAIVLVGFTIGYKVGCDISYSRFKEHIKKSSNKLYGKNKNEGNA